MSLPRFHLKIRHFYDIQIIILNGEIGLLSHEMVTRPNSSSSAPRGIFYLPKIFLFLALLVIKMLKLVNVSPGCCCRQEETKIGKRKFHSYITITRSKSFFLFFSRWNGHKICRLGIQIDKMRSFAFVVCWYTTKATGVFSLFFFFAYGNWARAQRERANTVRGEASVRAHNRLIAVWEEIKKKKKKTLFLLDFFVVVVIFLFLF